MSLTKVLGALCVVAMGFMIALGLDLVGVPNPLDPGIATVVIAPAVQKVEDRLPQSDFGCKEIYGECDLDHDYVEVPSSPKVPDASFNYVWGPNYQTV